MTIWKILKKLTTLVFGLFLFALGIVLTVHSQLGASPWDVFHLGVTNHTGLSLGQVSQLVGVILVIISAFLGEVPGIGTILNTILIGYFVDVLQANNLVPLAGNVFQQYLMLFLGIYLFGWATYFYMGTELGSGPRDSLMLALIKKTKKPVWLIRGTIETCALIAGYLMGGLAGIGTVLIAGLIGFSIQHVYKLRKQDPAQLVHVTLVDNYHFIRKLLSKSLTEEITIKQREKRVG